MPYRVEMTKMDGSKEHVDLTSFSVANRAHHAFNRLGVPTTLEMLPDPEAYRGEGFVMAPFAAATR
jgi:hypothetical protein